MLGEGSFTKVLLVTDASTGNLYTTKEFKKEVEFMEKVKIKNIAQFRPSHEL